MVRLRSVSILIVLVFVVAVNGEINHPNCIVGALQTPQCTENETCTPIRDTNDANTQGVCDCLPGYKRVSDKLCVVIVTNVSTTTPITSPSSLVEDEPKEGKSSHTFATVLFSLVFVALVICTVYFNYRYRFVSRVLSRLSQRRNNYDEVMIGRDLDDDDPPLR